MSDQRKFQLNIKFGGGYEAPLLNIEGDNPVEFQQNVEFALTSIEGIVDAAVAFQAAYNVKKPQDNPPARQGGQGATQARSWSGGGSQQSQTAVASGVDQTPPGPPPSCAHGEMRWVAPGISKATKKPYKGFWACTAPRDQQCDAVNA